MGKVPQALASSANLLSSSGHTLLEPAGLLVDELILGTLRGDYQWTYSPTDAWCTVLSSGQELKLSGSFLYLGEHKGLDLTESSGAENLFRLLGMLRNLAYYQAVFGIGEPSDSYL
jgi:hypothetical protein